MSAAREKEGVLSLVRRAIPTCQPGNMTDSHQLADKLRITSRFESPIALFVGNAGSR